MRQPEGQGSRGTNGGDFLSSRGTVQHRVLACRGNVDPLPALASGWGLVLGGAKVVGASSSPEETGLPGGESRIARRPIAAEPTSALDDVRGRLVGGSMTTRGTVVAGSRVMTSGDNCRVRSSRQVVMSVGPPRWENDGAREKGYGGCFTRVWCVT